MLSHKRPPSVRKAPTANPGLGVYGSSHTDPYYLQFASVSFVTFSERRFLRSALRTLGPATLPQSPLTVTERPKEAIASVTQSEAEAAGAVWRCT